MNEYKNNIIPGFLLAIFIGLATWFLSFLHTAVDSLVIGIIVGMIVRTIVGERPSLQPGLNKAVQLLIPIGIILYGSNLEFNRLVEVPTQVWLQLLVGISIIILVVSKFGHKLKLNKACALLIGVGTAICGASAIVLSAPVVNGKAEDTAKSLVVITILGLIGVILWPFVGNWLSFSTDTYAQFCATTLQQTGLVKTAAMARGPDCLATAMTIKMARITTIIPLILVVGVISRFKSMDEAAQSRKRLNIHIPWFLWAFIIVGLIFSYITPLADYAGHIKSLASIAWTMAMASVGLSVDIKRIISSIYLPLLLGLLAWIAAIAVFIVGTI